MLQTKQIRQGALVLHIEPDGQVKYEVCLPIPKEFFFSSILFSNSVTTINNRRFLRKWNLSWSDAMRFKLHAQVQIDTWKSENIIIRRNTRQTSLQEFLAR